MAVAARSTGGSAAGRRSRPVVALIAFTAAAGFFLINIVNPNASPAQADQQFAHVTDRFAGQQPQLLQASHKVEAAALEHVTYSSKLIEAPTAGTSDGGSADSSASQAATAPVPTAPAPSPGTAKAYAKDLLASHGMGGDQFSCLVQLWNRESGWNTHAANGSGAYGIPQALPGSKMSSAGPDWQNSYQTQIKWGLGYVNGRYGNPCGAWAHSESSGWY